MLKRRFNGFNGTFISINSFKSLILYSTSIASKDGNPNSLMVEFLVKSAGFTERKAASIVADSKVSNHFKSTKNCELVVDFLRNSGFDGTQIRKLLTSVPNVLHSSLENNLKPKIRAFQELGFKGSDLGLLVSQYPYVLHRSLKGHIVPTLGILKSIAGSSNEQLVRFILSTKTQLLLSSNAGYVPANIMLLQSYGVPSERIRWFIHRRPHAILSSTQWFEQVVQRVEEKLGIPRTSNMFLHGVNAMHRTTDKKLESYMEVLRSYGWREAEISSALARNPSSITIAENSLRVKLKYLMEDLGCGSDYLSKRPALLSFSLEKRMVPRTAVIRALKEKQLLRRDVSIYSCMALGESTFVEKYVLPIKDELPQVYEYYTQTTGRSRTKT